MQRRLVALATLTALAAGLIAAPTAAAGTVRYVDDDGTAGVRGCNGSAVVSTTIGGALAAAAPGDTILVCPGRYPERVTIDVKGVTVRAVQRWKAVIVPRTTTSDPIVRVDARDVTVQWLSVVARTTGRCSIVWSGIEVDSVAGARIVSNRVLSAANGDTLYGACGLLSGIGVTDGATDALVAHNVVRDFRTSGIGVSFAEARVIDNSLQYWHEGAACTSRLADCAPRRPAAALPPTGVYVYKSTAVVSLNATSNGPDGTSSLPYLTTGVSVHGSDGVRIRRNLIRRALLGIMIEDLDGARVAGNVVVGTGVKAPGRTTPAGSPPGLIAISVTDSQIRDSHVLDFSFGIVMGLGSQGNTIQGNDATGNGIDCQDLAGPVGETPVTDNTWIDNLGNADQPVGLCTDAPVQTEPGSPT
jgi:nitrous oxidase accessory protein NosD